MGERSPIPPLQARKEVRSVEKETRDPFYHTGHRHLAAASHMDLVRLHDVRGGDQLPHVEPRRIWERSRGWGKVRWGGVEGGVEGGVGWGGAGRGSGGGSEGPTTAQRRERTSAYPQCRFRVALPKASAACKAGQRPPGGALADAAHLGSSAGLCCSPPPGPAAAPARRMAPPRPGRAG